MDKEKAPPTNQDYTGFNESRLDTSVNTSKNHNLQGTILFSKKTPKSKKPFNWNRIRSFFITNKKLKRSVEFSCHPSGVHLLRLAVFHSENGCAMCRFYVEQNLF